MKKYLYEVLHHKVLDEGMISSLVQNTAEGHFNDSQIAALIMGLEMKKLTTKELFFFTKALQKYTSKIFPEAIDMTSVGELAFDVMTTAGFIAAGANAPLVKGVSRSLTSRIGSRDLLECLGVSASSSPEQLMKEVGFCFCFLTQHHPFMRNTLSARKSLGMETSMDVLFSMCHPFGIQKQVIGISNKKMRDQMKEVFLQMPGVHVLLLTGEDHYPGVSINKETEIIEIRNQKATQSTMKPQDFGFQERKFLPKLNLLETAETFYKILDGKEGPYTDLALMQASAAIYLSSDHSDWGLAKKAAEDSLYSGNAKKKFNDIISFSELPIFN